MPLKLNVVITPKGINEVMIAADSIPNQMEGIDLYKFLLPQFFKITELLTQKKAKATPQ